MKAIKLLKDHHIPVTDLRLDLLGELLNARAPMAYESFKTVANKSSFYRTMELFVSAKIASKIEVDGRGLFLISERAYALFVCDCCHHQEQIDLPPLQLHASSAVIRGVCGECESKDEQCAK